jgi:putative acyl-CoA dehydrogenase
VKGSNRHFDRRWRQLRWQLANPREGQAREITRELLQLASAAILLKVAEPPLADGWCQQHLDLRGTRALSDDLCARLLLRCSAA